MQDISRCNSDSLQHEQIESRNQTSHQIYIESKTLLYNIVKKNIINVNSAHHQAVDKLGNGLIVSSKATDGIIESIESINHSWCIGIQWHPEFFITKFDKLIFKDFIFHSKKYK